MKPAIIAGLVAALLAGGFWYRHHVYDSGYTAGVVYQQGLEAKALAQANKASQERADKMQADADESEMNRAIENEKHKTDLEAARADVRAGRERLSIAGRCTSGAAGGAQASAAAGPGQEARAYLLPETADAIISIAGASAEDVWAYNALLDRYNAVCK